MDTDKKHIIIAGVPRVGKTTVCSKLAQSLKYQHLAMDAIMIAFEEALPKMGIKHTDRWDVVETSKQIIKFVARMAQTGNYDKLDYRVAFDLYHITPKDYFENVDKGCCDIYFLGYPNITVEEKLKEIRKFDTQYDWTSKKSDDIIIEYLKDYIDISKWLQEECKKYQLPFVDVSHNREKVIDDLVRNILK